MLGSAIKELVVVKMDEHTPYGPANGVTLLAGGDRLSETKPIYDYIDANLAVAANEVLQIAPIHKLGYVSNPSVSCTADAEDTHIGSITLPEGFLRLHTLRMKGWVKPVHVAIHEEHPDYVKQFNHWNRGTKQKPVVTISGMDTQTLHYYSVDTDGHEAKEFKYIPEFAEAREYEDSVAEAIALNCARKVYEIYGNIEQAGLMKTEMDSVIETLRQ